MRALAAVVLVLAASTVAAAQPDPCHGIDCDGHGTCIPEQRVGHCLCDAGYSALGNRCIELDEPSEPLRARRDPTAGERVVEFARGQLGRTRAQVAGDGDDALRLGDFLAPGEWWCGDFVSWAYASAGVPLDGGDAGGWLVTNNVAIRLWYERRGLFIERGSPRMATYQPQPGDYLQLDSPSGGGHAAIVVRAEGDTVQTIEGNVSGTVETGTYHRFRQSRWIRGIGVFGPPDEPPTVEVGEDAETVDSRSLSLEAEVSDDGPAARLELTWSATGPGRGVFECPHDATSEVHFTRPGVYRVTLLADDGTHQTRDSRQITVRENHPPTVAVRLLEQSFFASDAQLTGTVDDDGLPEPVTARWSQVDGPATATIATREELATRVLFPAPGSYRFRLEANDGDRAGHADVSVVVRSPLGGCAVGHGRSPGAFVLGALSLLAWASLRRRRWP